jgi:beta-xylosidase
VVGAAISDSPVGPFTDIGHPLVRNESVGLIDVSFFQDPTTRKKYLIWKEDQNDFDPPRPTPLIMQEMASDGLSLVGNPKELLRNDQPWEGVLVEAPNIVYRNGWYYLFYSGNIFTDDAYSVGVARSQNVWGPYVKDPNPILTHDKYFSGPAHQYVLQDEKGTWHIFYHARLKSLERSRRYLMHDLIWWTPDGWPRVNDGHPGGPLNQKVVDEIMEMKEEANAARAAAIQKAQAARAAAAAKAATANSKADISAKDAAAQKNITERKAELQQRAAQAKARREGKRIP